MSNSKYDFEALVAKLNDADSVTMNLTDIENLVGPLCTTAKKNPAWWSGKDRQHLQPLFAAGYKAQPDLEQGIVKFKKATPSSQKSSPKNNASPKSNNSSKSNSPKKSFPLKKEEVEDFLNKTNAPEDISYYMKADLATMINMPFYKQDRGEEPSTTKSVVYIVLKYCDLLKSQTIDFQDKLLECLSRQQNQSMRKLSEPFNKGVWEHPIPLKHTRRILLDLIQKQDFDTIKKYLNFIHENAPQIYLRPAHDKKLTEAGLKEKMPDNWDWKTGDPFIRYKVAGIFEELNLNIIKYTATKKLEPTKWIKEKSFSHYFDGKKGYIVLEDSVTEIGDHAFENCKSLTSVEIPRFVTKIAKNAFEGCNNLSEETKELLRHKYNCHDF